MQHGDPADGICRGRSDLRRSRLELHPFDAPTARLSLALAVAYGLRAADAAHLATAVASGADRLLTNNRTDFPQTITEIDVVYPDELADRGGAAQPPPESPSA